MKKSISILLVVVMVLALSTTAFAAGQKSPGQVPEPPVLENKEIAGTGTTADGETLTVVAWDASIIPEDAPFTDEKSAIQNALESEAFKDIQEKLGIDPEKFSGSSMLGISFGDGSDETAPVPVALFYDGDGKPATGLYYYNSEWDGLEVKEAEDGEEGEYTLVFGNDEDGNEDETGLVAEVTVTITDKPTTVS